MFPYPKLPRLTKTVAEQYIASNIGFNPQQLNYIKLSEQPKHWKHSCVRTGVIVLNPVTLNYGESIINFTFCRACGKVHYLVEDPMTPSY